MSNWWLIALWCFVLLGFWVVEKRLNLLEEMAYRVGEFLDTFIGDEDE